MLGLDSISFLLPIWGKGEGQEGEGGDLEESQKKFGNNPLGRKKNSGEKFQFCWKKPQRGGVGGCYPPG